MAFKMTLNKKSKGTNKKYGLFVPKKKAAALDVFEKAMAQEESVDAASTSRMTDRERMNKQLDSLSSRKEAVAIKEQKKVLEQDPNAYDYDGVYDEIQAKRDEEAVAAREARESSKKTSKYIGTLLQQSKIRERENDRIRERLLLKERKEEDAMYGDKEKFVTTAYKKKLIENQRWEAEDKRLEVIEKAQDVTTRKGDAMAGFYANLLTKNIAMGGDVKENATSAYTAVVVAEEETPARQVSVVSVAVEKKEKEKEKPTTPKRSAEEMIQAAKERFKARQKK